MKTQFSEKFYRNKFVAALKYGEHGIFEVLSTARIKSAPDDYPLIVNAFKSCSRILANNYFSPGVKNFKELLWRGGIDPAIDLDSELKFAANWLSHSATDINNFREAAKKIEKEIFFGKLEEAKLLLDNYRKQNGWSVWIAELSFAIGQILYGSEEQRKYTAEHVKNSGQRIAALFAQVVFDRNDETFSYDGFMSKCDDSFPRIKIQESLKTYLFYRALGVCKNLELGLPVVLSCEIFGASVDCYETFIDVCGTICTRSELKKYLNSTHAAASILIKSGITDVRLINIARLSSGQANSRHTNPKNIEQTPVSIIVNAMMDENKVSEAVECQLSKIATEIIKAINVINENGVSDRETLTSLVKFGTNFRGLTIGSLIYEFASSRSTNWLCGDIIPGWINVVSEEQTLNQIFSLDNEKAIPYILGIANAKIDNENGTVAKIVLNVLDGRRILENELPLGVTLLWLARALAKQGRISEIKQICVQMENGGVYWRRQSHKLNILAGAWNNDLLSALSAASKALIENDEIYFEMPLAEIFQEHRWPKFKEIDPVLTGVISHYGYLGTGDLKIRHICRMACRQFDKTTNRSNLLDEWEKSDEDRRILIISFLCGVWIEENLSMVDLHSTQEVRLERIKILQFLIQVDQSKEQRYAEEIKDLTFNETLWRGLKHLNETRIFVNESAIFRGVEKELSPDFERWKKMRAIDSITPFTEDMLGQYFVSAYAETFENLASKKEISEADACLMSIVDRLRRKFLQDPLDGLDSYLSSRIRHGTLKGTVLGPLEESGLLISEGVNDETFFLRWQTQSGLEYTECTQAVELLTKFSKKIIQITESLIKENIQILSAAHPSGSIYIIFNEPIASRAFSELGAVSNFQHFVTNCFEVFWTLLDAPLKELSRKILGEFRDSLQRQFDILIEEIRNVGKNSLALTTTLRTLATATQSQCEIVADWFNADSNIENQIYSLAEAIEISNRATMNVYRLFSAKICLDSEDGIDLPLTAYGLATLTDCLYIIFENAWKYSGFAEGVPLITIHTKFDSEYNILTVRASSPLTNNVRTNLENGKYEKLRKKYLIELPVHLMSTEGGSGFAKLARMTINVDKITHPQPFKFFVNQDGDWEVKVCIPLYARGEAYDAYH